MRRRLATGAAAGGLIALVALALAGGPADSRASGATATKAGKGLKLKLIGRTSYMKGSDQKSRRVVTCPGRSIPLGGGYKASPPPGPDGEGAYPHSYERLGVQSGWHVTPVLFHPSSGQPTPRKVTLQVICRRQVPSVTRRRKITFVAPGQTKTVVVKCPGPRRLIGGGFQRTDFVSSGGNYVTESRAVNAKAWRVTGSAFGRFGGQLVSIVYCFRTKKPLVKAVQATTTVGPRSYASVRTKRCPRKRRMVFGGFQTSPEASMFIANGFFSNDHWTQSAFNYFGGEGKLTAYGYCVSLKRLGKRR
ncbi:hypothetical protein BH20ACT15_BH20ACT15_11380 [soil metagenome]